MVSDQTTDSRTAAARPPAYAFDPAQLEAYRGTGYELIPLHAPDALDACGRSIGKAPHRGWRRCRPLTMDEALEHISACNVGVRLGADDLVLDVDPRNFAEGDDPLARLTADLGLDLSAYPTVETGSGGQHIYMKMPAGTLVMDTLSDRYQGVEFKAHGRQVVAPGSVHPVTRKVYRVVVDGFAAVPPAPEALVGLIRRPERTSADGAGGYSPEWLSGALECLDVAEYRDHTRWLELMMACHHATAGDGRDEFVAWSTSDPEYADHGVSIGRRWDSLHADKGGRQITVRTLFRELNKAGAVVSRDPDAQAVLDDFPDDLSKAAADEVAPSDEQFMGPTEFVLDGFIPAALGVFAGAWGSGKTVNLIPLLATAAHVTPKGWTVGHAELRRHVVFLCEDEAQVRSTLYSLSKNEGAASLPEILEWMHFLPARRLAPDALAARVRKLGERFTYANEHGFPIRPVVVLDTANANCELESENDSRAVGQMMSALKRVGVPTIIVGHVAKAITKAEFAAHSFRGSGAWEADADFTGYLLHEADTDTRFLGMHKVRFVPDYREVEFASFVGSVHVGVPWHPTGVQEKRYLNGIPIRSSTAERKARAEKRQLEGKEREVDEAVTALLQEGGHPTVTAVKDRVKGKSAALTKVIDALCDEGRLVRHPAARHLSKEDREALGLDVKTNLLLPAGLALDTYVGRRLDKLPITEFDEVEADPLEESYES
ncbi:MAG: hypothetical protein B7Z08_04855 [Sphingomonadales bacterium 32-68-7]|nr:MAG: hypothetical protein B7Z33_08890 [Sphingomonadales bacterium 12-68-11]OYX09564.1 MAG: hypothetical protein B7Z08_04855 [Sphingomonadales bacterium 32-68-7]